VETPTANLTLNESEFHVDGRIAWRTGQVQFIRERTLWLAKPHLVDLAPAFNLVGDKVPRRDIREAKAGLRVYDLCRIPDDWLITGEIEAPEILVPRTPSDFSPQLNSALDKAHPERPITTRTDFSNQLIA
jgi:hypothetical protein